jgi:hypothetical protein
MKTMCYSEVPNRYDEFTGEFIGKRYDFLEPGLVIRMPPKNGGWLFQIGANVHETEHNFKVAQSEYEHSKALKTAMKSPKPSSTKSKHRSAGKKKNSSSSRCDDDDYEILSEASAKEVSMDEKVIILVALGYGVEECCNVDLRIAEQAFYQRLGVAIRKCAEDFEKENPPPNLPDGVHSPAHARKLLSRMLRSNSSAQLWNTMDDECITKMMNAIRS